MLFFPIVSSLNFVHPDPAFIADIRHHYLLDRYRLTAVTTDVKCRA